MTRCTCSCPCCGGAGAVQLGELVVHPDGAVTPTALEWALTRDQRALLLAGAAAYPGLFDPARVLYGAQAGWPRKRAAARVAVLRLRAQLAPYGVRVINESGRGYRLAEG